MGYFQIPLYTRYVQDWQKSHEIARSFLNQNDMIGFSYNGYIGMGEPLSHITVRFNFKDDEEGKQNNLLKPINLTIQNMHLTNI